MGYTTEFHGQFQLDKQMNDLSILDKLNEWADCCKDAPINGYCQWKLSKDRMAIQWDGNEKFYDYDKWLQFIIDLLLLPNHYILSGKVEFQGEAITDHGWLYIEENIVKIRKIVGKVIKCPECGHQFMIEQKEDE